MDTHYKFRDGEQRKFLSEVTSKSGLSNTNLAKYLKISRWTYKDWVSGRYCISALAAKSLSRRFGIDLPENYKVLTERWKNSKIEAGKIGGLICFKKYGGFATPEGRIKGGQNSIKNRKPMSNYFFVKEINRPEQSEELSELVGIMIGDGGLTQEQARVTLNLFDDSKYSEHVAFLFEKLFKTKPSVYPYFNRTTVEVVTSSKNLVKFLNFLGLPIGNKIRQQIDIPGWIKKNKNFCRACVRGIFDTDGCIYQDRHTIKDKNYSSLNIAIVSASPKLLLSIREVLTNEGLSPTISTWRSVRLRKTKQVGVFFDKIGSNNPKHVSKYRGYLAWRGTEVD